MPSTGLQVNGPAVGGTEAQSGFLLQHVASSLLSSPLLVPTQALERVSGPVYLS